MVNVTGGFAYIDMSVFGKFTQSTPKAVDLTIGDMLAKLKQLDKPTIVRGLTITVSETDFTLPSMAVGFVPTTEDDEIVYKGAMIFGDSGVAITISETSNTITIAFT